MSPNKKEDINKKQENAKLTPMMQQYLGIKERYPEEVLFFRMGDFYEMFFEDAQYASGVLNIALTKRQDEVPMCGIPYHALHNYVHPILEDGRKIAICEQVEDPKSAEGKIVRRDVVRVLTPGTIFEEELLSDQERRLVAAAGAQSEGSEFCYAAICDMSTGDIWLQREKGEINWGALEVRGVREAVASQRVANSAGVAVFERDYMLSGRGEKILKEAFELSTLAVFDLDEDEVRVLASMFLYIKEVSPSVRIRWKSPVKEYLEQTMVMDEAAIRTLEILKSQSGGKKGSLLGTLDETRTAGGRRLLGESLRAPSLRLSDIRERHTIVEFLLGEKKLRGEVREILRNIFDPERTLLTLRHSPQVRHLGQMLQTLEAIMELIGLIEGSNGEGLPESFLGQWRRERFPAETAQALNEALYMEELPPLLDERRFLRAGYNGELDELFYLAESAGKIMVEFEKSERQKWDLPSLKVRYNKVIGYYLEISKGQAERAPEVYVRRQTLVNAERYTCDELKDLEEKILGAREKIVALQRSLFQGLVEKVLEETDLLRVWAKAVSTLDMLAGFAEAAAKNRYTRPQMEEGGPMELRESRHPVVEALFREEIFVPNDVLLNNSDRHLAILTGPNMAGKSTFIRQTGLIQVMAQAGSFVPAAYARLPLADRIFTRIGAYDRLFSGESTFYVEMAECARLFRNFTERSLILLDEVGRGTSTFDGISIARAMVEYLNDPALGRPKTLFATHYAELAGMIEKDNGIIGLTVQVLEEADRIVFLRKIAEGTADKSYGIYVARLAGLPEAIIERAGELLAELEEEGMWSKEPHFQLPNPKEGGSSKKQKSRDQLSMF